MYYTFQHALQPRNATAGSAHSYRCSARAALLIGRVCTLAYTVLRTSLTATYDIPRCLPGSRPVVAGFAARLYRFLPDYPTLLSGIKDTKPEHSLVQPSRLTFRTQRYTATPLLDYAVSCIYPCTHTDLCAVPHRLCSARMTLVPVHAAHCGCRTAARLVQRIGTTCCAGASGRVLQYAPSRACAFGAICYSPTTTA